MIDIAEGPGRDLKNIRQIGDGSRRVGKIVCYGLLKQF